MANVRGKELEALVVAAGLSVNQFQERVATAVVGQVASAADEKRRVHAKRTVKRWFREDGANEIRPQQHYRDAVRIVLGADPWQNTTLEDRLRSLEERYGDLVTKEDLKRSLDVLRAAIAAQASRGSQRANGIDE